MFVLIISFIKEGYFDILKGLIEIVNEMIDSEIMSFKEINGIEEVVKYLIVIGK